MQQFCKTFLPCLYKFFTGLAKKLCKKAREIRVKILNIVKHHKDKKKFLKTLEDKIKNEHNKIKCYGIIF